MCGPIIVHENNNELSRALGARLETVKCVEASVVVQSVVIRTVRIYRFILFNYSRAPGQEKKSALGKILLKSVNGLIAVSAICSLFVAGPPSSYLPGDIGRMDSHPPS